MSASVNFFSSRGYRKCQSLLVGGDPRKIGNLNDWEETKPNKIKPFSGCIARALCDGELADGSIRITQCVGFDGVVVSVVASHPSWPGFNPSRSRWHFLATRFA